MEHGADPSLPEPSSELDPAAARYWDQWNRDWRFRTDVDPFMARQLELALQLARRENLQQARILDVGCGNGWLGHGLSQFGEVWGTDLSPMSIADGSRRYPELHLICADFLKVELPGPFDFIVSADAIVHMADYEGCMRRFAGLLRPGGMFLLMTQNPWIWARRSRIRHVPSELPHSSPSDWPGRSALSSLMRPWFQIEAVSTFDPGGDTGRLWWVEHRLIRGGMGRLVGRERWRSLLEKLGLGRELVIVARRRS